MWKDDLARNGSRKKKRRRKIALISSNRKRNNCFECEQPFVGRNVTWRDKNGCEGDYLIRALTKLTATVPKRHWVWVAWVDSVPRWVYSTKLTHRVSHKFFTPGVSISVCLRFRYRNNFPDCFCKNRNHCPLPDAIHCELDFAQNILM